MGNTSFLYPLHLHLQLRFNKVSELIHNSTNFQNLDSAKVTVYFEDIIDKVGGLTSSWGLPSCMHGRSEAKVLLSGG